MQGKLEEAVEVVSQMVSRKYLLTPQSKMNEAARNVDHLCNEYLTEMSAVAAIAAMAVKKQDSIQVDGGHANELAPELGEIPPGGGEIPEHPTETRFRFIGLLNPDGTLHILRVPEGELEGL